MRNISPPQLIVRLIAYYAVVFALVAAVFVMNSDALRILPFGGTDALQIPGIEISETTIQLDSETPRREIRMTPKSVVAMAVFLATTLITTIVVMIPVTWTYAATRFDAGPSKVFVRTLLLLPICAATVVLLIQDSLALAFGLAALVAAVRFRVALPDSIDGIYIFAAICVGLAAGIGYMGIALVMTVVFTLTSAVLWQIDYGRNPIDDARHETRAAKLAAKMGGDSMRTG